MGGAIGTWNTRHQLTGILKEVQMPPALLHPIIDRAPPLTVRTEHSRFSIVLEDQFQLFRFSLKLRRAHSPPRPHQLQGRIKKFIRRHLSTLTPPSNP